MAAILRQIIAATRSLAVMKFDLIAQQKNNDQKPIYGGYLIGTGWHFTTLIGNDYCVSQRIEVSVKSHLLQTVYMLRELKNLILKR